MRVNPRTLMELHESGELLNPLGKQGDVDIDWGEDADEVIRRRVIWRAESCESCQ